MELVRLYDMKTLAIGMAVVSLVVSATAQVKTEMGESYFAAELAALGYTYSPAYKTNAGSNITRDGIRVSAFLTLSTPPGGKPYTRSIRLTNRYQLDQPMDSSALNERGWDPFDCGITFTHYLDHTVVASREIFLQPGYDRERLRFELELFWQGLKRFQQLLSKGGFKVVEQGSSVEAPLDENAWVDRALAEDFGFLVRKWGWLGNGPAAGNSFTWWQSPIIHGHQADLRGVIEDGVIDPYKFTIRYGQTAKTVDLRKGMTVRKLRKLIENFVDSAAVAAR